MFWKVTAVLPFTSQDEANDFFHDCQVALPKANTINPGNDNEEKGIIQIHECFHDEDPNRPCDLLEEEFTP